MLQSLLKLACAACMFVGGTGLIVCQATGHGISTVAPWSVGPISVMVVEETSERDKLTKGQLDIIGSHADGSFQDWLKKHGEPDPWRLIDKDDSMAQDDPKWQTAFAAKGDSVPWMLILRGGKVLASGAMPKTAEETMRIVKRYGGE